MNRWLWRLAWGITASAVLLTGLLISSRPPDRAWAQGVGLFQRATCSTITSAVAGSTWCLDTTNRVLKVFNSATFSTVSVVNVQAAGAVGDGVTDDTAAIQAAITATPPGGTLIIPDAPNFYLLTDTLTVTKAIRITGAGYRMASGVLSGAVLRQTGGAGKDVFYIDNGGADLDGLVLEHLAFGTTSTGRYALRLGANVNRSTFRNLLIAGAGTAGVITDGNNILNVYESVRISMGFTESAGYGNPARGFDFRTGGFGPNTLINCGVAGVTTAPGIGLDLNGSATWINLELENNTVGLNWGTAANQNVLLNTYVEGNGTLFTGTAGTQPRNLAIGDATGNNAFALTASLGANLRTTLVTGGSSVPVLTSDTPVVFSHSGTTPAVAVASLHVTRAGAATDTGLQTSDIPIVGQSETNTDGTVVAQFVASGATPDAYLNIYARSGTIGLQARRYSTSAGTTLALNYTAGGVTVGTPTEGGRGTGTFNVASSTLLNGVVALKSTGAPTCLSGCGDTPTVAGTDSAMRVTVSTNVTTVFLVNFATAWAGAPACVAMLDGARPQVATVTHVNTTATGATINTIEAPTNGTVYTLLCQGVTAG